MEATINQNVQIKTRRHIFSRPLFLQSLKSNWVFWLVLTLANALMIGIINLVMGSSNMIHAIDMKAVNNYLEAEGWNWLQALGLFQEMGFSLNRIQAMTSIDMSAVFNHLVYSIAGILLPMVYIIVTSNKLVASQIDSGSMAYVLSTPTNRKSVIRTQYLFLIVSVFAMYLIIGSVAVLTEYVGYGKNSLPIRTFLLNVGSLCCALAICGITFFASCLFSRSKNSLALGGGLCIFFFLANILGLFGSKAFVAMGVGVSGMNVFNYLTIFNLFDATGISSFCKYITGNTIDGEFTVVWAYKLIGLIALSIVGYIGGNIIFSKKDLPL